MKPEELEYNGDKIIKYEENDYVGFYWGVDGPDGDMEVVRATSYEEVCKKLDECNAFVREERKGKEE